MRGTPHWLWLVVLFVALAAACSERLPARFPHTLHLAGIACGGPGQRECLSCTSCHALSRRDAEHALPSVGRCKTCHHEDRHDLLTLVATSPERPNGEITFDHARHLARRELGGQCVQCHAGVVQSGAPRLPPMATCFGCHEHEAQWTRGQCTPCHAQGELKRLLPKTFLRHEGNFAKRHGADAAQQRQLCQACHEQVDCDSCHDTAQDLTVERRRPEALTRSFVHRGDFMTSHALEAQSQPARCQRCHTPDTCEGCHRARGVSGGLLEGRNPHPPGWVGTNTNARSFHGSAARRDILLCASCHDQGPATNCIRCHKVGGYGGNPHPSGWKSTQGQASQMCRYCHE